MHYFWAILDLRWSDTRTPSENPWLLASPDWLCFRPLLRCLNLHASSFNGLCWILHLSEKFTWPNLRLGVTQLTTWTAPWLQEPHRGPPLLTLPPVSLTAVNNSKFNPIMFSLAGIFENIVCINNWGETVYLTPNTQRLLWRTSKKTPCKKLCKNCNITTF